MSLTILLPSGEAVELGRGYHLVGHDASCAIRLHDPRVARHHCLIQARGDGAQVIDLASGEGTYLGGRRLPALTPFSLSPGDEIRAGSALLSVAQPVGARVGGPSAVQLALLPNEQEMDGLSLFHDAASLEPAHEDFSEESFRRLNDLSRRLKFLNDFSNSVAGLFDPDEAMRFVMANAMKLIPADSGIVFLRRGTEMVAKLYWRSGKEHAISKARCSRRLLRKVIDERVGLIFREPRASEYENGSPGVHLSTMMIPLIFEDELLGVMALHSSPERPEFSRGDLILLSGLAKQIAVHLENSRLVSEIRTTTAERERLKRELEISAAIQRDALPPAPTHLAGLGCASLCVPAHEVGGDFVDFVEHPDGALGICVGDVMGKGLPAALFMMEVKSILHSCALSERDPGKVLEMANALICKKASRSLRMATVCYAVIDGDRQSFGYASAGHCPALLLRPGGVVASLDPTGMMLGVDARSPIVSQTHLVSSQHALFMYTDGAIDARSPTGEPVGTERLAALAATHSHAEPHRAIAGIQRDITEFAGGSDLLDDLTMAWATIHAPAE
jgi:sigma-B regulation protein RsbU (phosphoserine phosphatase)